MKTEAKNPAGGRQGRNYTPLLGELRPAGGLRTQERSQGASPLRLLRCLSPIKFKDRQLNRGGLIL